MKFSNVCFRREILSSDEVEYLNGCANFAEAQIANTGHKPVDIVPDSMPETKDLPPQDLRISEVRWIDSDKIDANITDKIYNTIVEICRNEMNCFFDVYRTECWQHTTYYGSEENGGHYNWHQDEPLLQDPKFYKIHYDTGEPFIRKISASILMNDSDEYEGGEFEWIDGDRLCDTIPENSKINVDSHKWVLPESYKKKGSVVVFPSLTHHRVTPVIRGIRKSLVIWLGGQPYV